MKANKITYNIKKICGSIKYIADVSVKFKIGLILLAFIIFFGGILPFFAPYDTRTWNVVPKNKPPSYEYPFGTSSIGRDLFWETAYSTRNSLIIGLMTAMIASHIGLLIGLAAGMKGGIFDRFLMFITDSFVIIPGLPLLMVVTQLLKPILTMPLLGLVISIVSWPWPARQVRAMVLSLRERTFVVTARLSGMGLWKIILNELMPFLLGWHLINFTNTILFSIGTEAGLAVLGLSILGENTLGVEIYWALAYFALLRGLWWWIAFPVLFLIIIFVTFYLLSMGLTEYLNVRVR